MCTTLLAQQYAYYYTIANNLSKRESKLNNAMKMLFVMMNRVGVFLLLLMREKGIMN